MRKKDNQLLTIRTVPDARFHFQRSKDPVWCEVWNGRGKKCVNLAEAFKFFTGNTLNPKFNCGVMTKKTRRRKGIK